MPIKKLFFCFIFCCFTVIFIKAFVENSYSSEIQDKKLLEVVVKEGENISVLAKKYGTTTEDIIKINNLKKPFVIKYGQKIKIPAAALEVVVKEGENISVLAKKYGTTTEDIIKINNLKKPFVIKYGQKIKIQTPANKRTDVDANDNKIEEPLSIDNLKDDNTTAEDVVNSGDNKNLDKDIVIAENITENNIISLENNEDDIIKSTEKENAIQEINISSKNIKTEENTVDLSKTQDSKSTPVNNDFLMIDDKWAPAVDLDLKSGNKRSLGRLNFRIPLYQDYKSLLFVNYISMIDDNDADEMNLGLGYRKFNDKKNRIYGIYGFYDKRNSEFNNEFEQSTFGLETLGNFVDARINFYQPIGNDKKQTSTVAIGDDPKFSGSNVYVIGADSYEKIMKGYDVEIGSALPFYKKIRLYTTYYDFSDSVVEDISGYRIRGEYKLNDYVTFESEWQNDNVRGDIAFFGLKLSYFFGADTRSKLTDLEKRMMNPIVRDIDIVTNEKIPTDYIVVKAVDENGNELSTNQKIIFVNNQAASGGDGTKDHPYNTLALAQSNSSEYDIIYIHKGDGTFTNLNTGITLKNNQKLIGESQNLNVNVLGRNVTVLNGKTGFSPTLTNTSAVVATNYVVTLADYSEVAGLIIDSDDENDDVSTNNAQGISSTITEYVNIHHNTIRDSRTVGIYLNSGNVKGKIDNNTIENAIDIGIFAGSNTAASNNPTIGSSTIDLEITNNTINDVGAAAVATAGYGIYVANINSNIDSIKINNNTVINTNNHSIYLNKAGTGSIKYARIENNEIDNSSTVTTIAYGVNITNAGSRIIDMEVNDNSVKNASAVSATTNNRGGISLSNTGLGRIDTIKFDNNTITGNRQNGLFINSNNAAGTSDGFIDKLYVTNNSIKNNAQAATFHGLSVTNQNDSTINNLDINNNTISNNGVTGIAYGLNISNVASCKISNLKINDNTISNNNNTGIGVLVASSGGGDLINSEIKNNTIDQNSLSLTTTTGTFKTCVRGNKKSDGNDIIFSTTGSIIFNQDCE
jgi:LysM repeat protein